MRLVFRLLLISDGTSCPRQAEEEKAYFSVEVRMTAHCHTQHQQQGGWELNTAREPGAGAEAEPWRVLFTGSLFIEPRTTNPEMTLPTMGWAFPYQ